MLPGNDFRCVCGTGVCHAHRHVREAEGAHGHDDDDGWQVISESRCADLLPDCDTGPCMRFSPARRTRSGGLSGTGRSTRTSTSSRLVPGVPCGARSGTGILSRTASPSWCSWSDWRPCRAVRRGTRFRCSSSGQPFPLCLAAGSPRGPREQRPAPPRPRTSGMAARSRAALTAGWVAGTAPPACPRCRATRCRQVTSRGWY